MTTSVGRGRIVVLALGVLLFPAAALACLWDSDTLRAEARGLPGLVNLLTGRFEREPALYYEMRLARVAALVESEPGHLGLYDDAAVACDRLGRHDEAIEWMARKRAQLDAADRVAGGAAGNRADASEHEYRYLANLGTFHAHRWLASGASRDGTADLAKARDLIAAAIALNPEAHFGREKYQLMAIEWLLEPLAPLDEGERAEMASIFDRHAGYRGAGRNGIGRIDGAEPADAVEGLSGLIALGAAWESIDIIYSLSLALEGGGDHAMAHLARLRCIELAERGRGSLDPHAHDSGGIIDALRSHHRATMVDGQIEAFYPRARANADRWKAARDEFMLARLAAGRHPDTDPAFWDGYREVAAVAIPDGIFGLAGHRLQAVAAIGIAGGTIALIVVLVIWRGIRRRRRRAKDADLVVPGLPDAPTIGA